MPTETDYLRLEINPGALKVLKKTGESDEAVVFSCKLTKVNKYGKAQIRALLITTKAIYNLLPTDYGKCKRRIPIKEVVGLSAASTTEEFVLHVDGGWDYAFQSPQKNEIIAIVNDLYFSLTGKKLKINMGDKIDKPVLTIPPSPSSKSESSPSVGESGPGGRKRLGFHTSGSSTAGPTIEEKDEEDDDVVNLMDRKTKIRVTDFEVLRQLGRGAFGQVIQVKHKMTGKVYAMKVIKKRFILEQQKVEHTLSERTILAAFDNPFIMALKFAFQEKTKLYFVMDFYQGGELLVHLHKKKIFTEDEARIIFAEVLLALGHLHSLNFIYRDIKPENILMGDDGHVCLTDFGLVKQVDPSKPESTSFVGTPHYMAPELVQQYPHNRTVDWWSMGILLYELVVGIPPFLGDSIDDIFKAILTAEPAFPAWVTPVVRDLISRLLIKDPAKRLGSGEGDFEEIMDHPFFEKLSWKKVYDKDIKPLYVPEMKPAIDLDATLTRKAIAESVTRESISTHTFPHVDFENFTYVRQSIAERLATRPL